MAPASAVHSPSAFIHPYQSMGKADSFAAYLNSFVKIDEFVYPETERPNSGHQHYASRSEIPEIDLSALRNEDLASRKSIAREMCTAAKNWGFFRIVNHGVSADIVSRTEKQARKLFKLPLDQKLKASGTAASPFGYSAAGPSISANRSWHETLYFLCQVANIKEVARKLWPSDRDFRDFCKDLNGYSVGMNKLGQQIMELLLEGLGLNGKALYKQYAIENTSSARINYYPPCPQPEVTFGLPAHTDSGTLTILHQDAVGGLQVNKNGKWVGVSPQAGSFIINVGDCFQVWSNCQLKSVEHRVLVNSTTPRMSLAFFYNPSDSTIVSPISDLVDKDHPAIYKPFTWAEYRTYAGKHKGMVKNALDHFRMK